MDILEGVAREKVESLPFVDEIEVYLGYPTMLKDELELPINIGEMLYFACSGITQQDLSKAKILVNSQLNNKLNLSKFLITRDKWVEALKTQYPKQIAILNRGKEAALDVDDPDYKVIGKFYNEGLIKLTLEAIS